MGAIFSGFSLVLNGITAAYKIVQLLVTLYKTLRDARRERDTERAVDGNESGDMRKVEEGLGSDMAGKPSGIGQVRNKK